MNTLALWGQSYLLKPIHDLFWNLGHFFIFSIESVIWFFRKPFRLRLLLDEIEFIGNQSVMIVALTAVFTGAVFTFQSWLAFSMVGLDSMVGPTVGLSITRELAPVLTGIVVAGRAGAAMAAKLGIMRVTEQIDALEVMAIAPKQYLVGPRVLGAMIATPLLVAIFSLIGILGGLFVGVFVCHIDGGIFLEKLRYFMDPWDFYHGVIKGLFFGFIFSSIGCYQGFYTTHGAEGVGKATNQSVVYSIVSILVSDYFLAVIIPTGMRSQ